MKILIVDTCYPAFLEHHYQSRPGLAEASYAEQWRSLMDTFFGTADAYSFYLGQLGHQAHEVIANCEPLQEAWSREHGFRPRGISLPHLRLRESSTVLAQIDDYGPDVVYVQNLAYLDRVTLRRIRKRGILVAGQIASEAPSPAKLRSFDLILTSFPHFVERFQRLGVDTEYFRIGFDPRVLDHSADVSQSHDVVFVGSLNRTQHEGGNDLLAEAAERMPIDIWGYAVDTWPPGSALRRAYHGEAWGLEMFRILRSSRISLNRHIDVAEGYANNMRLYEATGVGSMLLTDAKGNLATLFSPGHEVVTYTDAAELVDKARYYLEHPDERAAIARAGQERTLREHTYGKRMEELAMILERRLGVRR